MTRQRPSAVDETTERLPPGQLVTRRFPTVGERAPAPGAPDASAWTVRVDGLVDDPTTWSLDELAGRSGSSDGSDSSDSSDTSDMGAGELVADIHCVTGWSRRGVRWTGVPLHRLLAAAGPEPEARYVRFEASSARGHDTSLPLDVATRASWVVWAFDGRPLAPEHGGPVRIVTTGRYFYKSLKWLRRVEVLAEDRPGYWERESAYHPNGDVWSGVERFSSGALSPAQVRRFLAAADYSPWRARPVIGADLRSWRPATADLRGLQLKACDLRGVRLAGADLRRSNLSLSDLRGADLSGADLRDADLEGANLGAARLRDADLRGAALTATRFADGDLTADVTGADLRGSHGLLESQQDALDRR